MKLLVLDGNSILNRAFYGIRLLTTRDGQYTNGIYGFLNILNKLREDVRPDTAAVAFDLPAPTFRHKAYDAYKAGRKKMPDELHAQMQPLKEILSLMGVCILTAEGYEADDILGTLAHACAAAGNECVIATGDRDSLQLVGNGVTVLLAGTKGGRPETTVYDEAKIREVYGVTPAQLVDVKALMGDSSDNIPGVPGVGEKTALSLIAAHGTLDAVYDGLDEIEVRPAVREKLRAGRESAYMSRDLARIRTDAPVQTDPETLCAGKADLAGLRRMFAKLEFFKLIEKLDKESGAAQAAETPCTQNTDAQGLPYETARDADSLLQALAARGRADFCFAAGSAAFALGTGVVIARENKTKNYETLAAKLLENEAVLKNTYDAKRFFTLADAGAAAGKTPGAASVFDVMLAGYLLNPLASGYAPGRLCDEQGVTPPAFAGGPGLSQAETDAARDALAVFAVSASLLQKIKENGQEKLLFEVEIPLARVLADMEAAGFCVDAAGIKAYGDTLGRKLDAIQSEIYGYAGYEFNINSTKQLGEALFVKLGLPPKKKTKTGFSTDAEVLEALRGFHPVIELLLEYRQLSKLKSTYTDGLLKVIAPDGRIHSSFNQVETRTGRISSTEPNLQNIPVRSEAGRELRRFFVAKPGCVLVDADYSQIELRILAHIADDAAMIDAFNRHADIHTITASQVFGMPPEMVTPLMRSRAKAVNFGIVYGIGAFSLSQDIGVSVKEADRYIKNYLDTFSGVRGYMERVIREAYDKGYVETLLGRRRALPELASSNRNLRNFGERVARNTPIQGTAADVIKIAMVRVRDRLAREGLAARLILQVHDELIVEAPEAEAEAAARILKQEMEGAVPMKVTLEADVHSGRTWYDAKG